MNHFRTAAFASLLLLSSLGTSSKAQAQVNVNINIPSWGVAAPAGTQYYYVPEYGGYYDLRDQRYIVLQNGQWVRVASVPGYAPTAFHPVVINYVGTTPWVYIADHKAKYGHPHGMPPGQAKKMYGGNPGKGHGNGKGKGKGKH